MRTASHTEFSTLLDRAREGEWHEALARYLGQAPEAFLDLDKYVLIDPMLDYTNPAFEAFILNFYERFSQETGFLRSKHRHVAIEHLKIVIVNLLKAFFKPGEFTPAFGAWVAYPRGNNANGTALLTSKSEKTHFSVTSLVQVVDALHEAKYINHAKGYNDRAKRRDPRLSRMQVTQKLLDSIEEAGVFRLEVLSPPAKPKRGLALLKRPNAEDRLENAGKSLQGNAVPEPTRTVLDRFNKRLGRVSLTAPTLSVWQVRQLRQKGINLNDKKLRRYYYGIENPNRFYCHSWQGIDSALRPLLQINGSAVTEYDLEACQLHLCYHLAGIDLRSRMEDRDPYSLPSLPTADRDVVKTAFACVLNTDDDKAALGALGREFGWKEHDLKAILEALRHDHPPIFEQRRKGAWLALNAVESEFTLEVIRRALEANVVVLPVHDSLIAPCEYGNWLKHTMEAALSSVGIISRPTVPLK